MGQYLPSHFQGTEADIRDALTQADFSTLITVGDDSIPVITHLPILYVPEENLIYGHVATKNHHWKLLDSRESTWILHGPHSFVSSRWYENLPSGPSWNYVSLHVRGPMQILPGEKLSWLVRTLAARFDDFTGREITEDYIQNLIHAFVGFMMPAENIDAKFKLSQNRSMRDRELTAENLRLRAEKHDVAVAEWMERFIERDRD